MNDAAVIRDLARELLASMGPEQASLLRGGLDNPRLREWTYLPGDRPGLPFAGMDDGQRQLAIALLEATHSAGAAPTVLGAIEVERVRRQLATGRDDVGPDRYWLRVLGDPAGDQPWGWRINGHHLAVHLVVVGDELTVTPHFVGSEPAEIREGPQTGRRLLGPEEDLARALLTSLDPDQRGAAVFADAPPADILTRADPIADATRLPPGLSRADLNADQHDLLDRLVRRYLDRSPTSYARQCWDELTVAGLDQLGFAWAGGARRGDRHYYCVTGPDILIEYDNQQDDGNHAHSVWRHLRDDWGGDLLRAHYETRHAGG